MGWMLFLSPSQQYQITEVLSALCEAQELLCKNNRQELVRGDQPD